VSRTVISPPAKSFNQYKQNASTSPSNGEPLTFPQCLLPLQTEEARTEYATLAQLFAQAGKLTPDAHRTLSEYAAQFDGLHVSLARGLPVRPSRFDQLRRARKALRLRDLEAALIEPQEPARVNRYANCGFANRGL
jgi:hypothetical protein